MKASSGKRSEGCRAYQWWNSQIPNIKNKNQPPEVVLPNEAHDIWAKICPFFLLFVIDEQDVQVYWESIQTIVNMFVGDQIPVPNPISRFPDFIQIVYKYQDILIPKTVEHCIYFIKKFGFHDAAHFFLYQSPVFFFSPTLYLETLLELRHIHHFIWTDFVKNPLLVDAFFEMYLSFFVPIPPEPDPTIYAHRNALCEVFYSLIQDSLDHHPNISNLVTKFFDSCFTILIQTSSDQLFPIYRSIFSIFTLAETKNIVSQSDLQSRAHQLFEETIESPTIYLTFKFLYGKQYLTSIQIIDILSHHGITSLHHLTILFEITDQSTALPLLLLLLRTALQSHTWHRTCFSLIRRCLAKISPVRSDIRELFQGVIRRLFLWISFASMRRKYCVRSLLLCESLVLLYESRIGWLQQSILSSAVSLISASKPLPVYFRSFFPAAGAAVDEVTLHEWELFAQSVKLKTFPFDASYATIAMATVKDGRRPVGGQSAVQNFSHQKSQQTRIKVHQAEARKIASSSSLALPHTQFLGQKETVKVKSKINHGNSVSASFAAARKIQVAAQQQKKTQTAIVIKRPESTSRIGKCQSEIKIHPKKRDALLS